ncbi:MAG: response regulator [Deltaproteobacteria bacterium]|nr:response regulator [Deltaproteobacteria bacterium]
MAQRVLVVEDEKDLATVVAYNLRAEGLDVIVAENGEAALREATSRRLDLVVLDLNLPDISGLEVCRRLKANAATRDLPILIASARGEEVDRVVGLELGADDYVVKPFSVRELVLRVRAILRRAEGGPPTADVVEFGCLKIDRAAHRVFVHDQEVQLTALELRLLTTLQERKNRTQSRDTLLIDVWQLNTPIESRTVDTHVKRLREKLGPAASYIRTVRGIGYRFAESPDEPME